MTLTGSIIDQPRIVGRRSTIRSNVDDPIVMHVTTGFEIGGSEALLLNLVEAARARGRESIVVSLIAHGPMRRRFEAEGVEVCDLGMRRGVPSLGGMITLTRMIRERKPDIVQGWLYHGIIAATLALNLSGRRRQTGLIHGIYGSNINFRSYRPRVWLSFRLAALASRSADVAVYNTNVGEVYHRGSGFRYKHSVTIDNGINTDRFATHPGVRAEMRSRLGIGEHEIVVLAIARLDPMKGWDRLLRISERVAGIRLVAVGHGTETFPDHPSRLVLGARDDIPALLAAADLFVSGSLFGEGTSVAVTEAMAASLPVIATSVGDHPRMLEGCGRVVDSADEAALEAAIRELVANPETRRELGRAAAAKVARAYGVESALDAYYRVYGSIAHHAGAQHERREPARSDFGSV